MAQQLAERDSTVRAVSRELAEGAAELHAALGEAVERLAQSREEAAERLEESQAQSRLLDDKLMAQGAALAECETGAAHAPFISHIGSLSTCVVQYGHLCDMAICANMITRAIWSPVQYGHPCDMATCGTCDPPGACRRRAPEDQPPNPTGQCRVEVPQRDASPGFGSGQNPSAISEP